MLTITRKIEFDAGHRLVGHESKCKHLHGHRYTAEITMQAEELDSVGRVVDFSVVKDLVGGWIDNHWDHNMILNQKDPLITAAGPTLQYVLFTKTPFVMSCNPTAENMVCLLADISEELLQEVNITVTHIRLYETPNCWADWNRPDKGTHNEEPTKN